jgi:tetratricopeptide (TPR) repeat protein
MPKTKTKEKIDIMRRPIRPYMAAQKTLEKELAEYQAAGNNKGMMESMLQLAVVYCDIGHMKESEAILGKCESYVLRYGLNEQKGLAMFAHGRILSDHGSYEAGLSVALKGLHFFLLTDIYEYIAKSYILCGLLCRHQQMYQESLEYMNHAVEASLKTGISGLTCMCMQNMNEVKLDLLSVDESIKSFNEFLKYLRAVYKGQPSHSEANALLCLSELYLDKNDIKKAKEAYLRGDEIKDQLGSNAREVDFINRCAQIAGAEGKEEELLQKTEKAINISREQKQMIGERWAHAIRCDFYTQKGDTETAGKHLKALYDLVMEKSPNQMIWLYHPTAIKYYQATGDLLNELKYSTELSKHEIEKQQQIARQRLIHATAVHELEIKEKENEIMK